MLRPVFRAGETYAVDRDISETDALAFWCAPAKTTCLAEDAAGAALGSFYMAANQGGGGAHVANAGFVTAASARGRGVARAMLRDALDRARGAGFRAMQFNFVVATNTGAIALWRSEGFEIVGRLPGAFRHPGAGEVDALVMYRRL
ncbi:MAG: GNAT family N-acetyltransferase [Paracoccaceae bacterium]